MASMKIKNDSNDTQMELGFANLRGRQAVTLAGESRNSRAGWWFERMRRIVERAYDWQPAPLPRPEQIFIRSVFRQPQISAPTPATEEQQVCE